MIKLIGCRAWVFRSVLSSESARKHSWDSVSSLVKYRNSFEIASTPLRRSLSTQAVCQGRQFMQPQNAGQQPAFREGSIARANSLQRPCSRQPHRSTPHAVCGVNSPLQIASRQTLARGQTKRSRRLEVVKARTEAAHQGHHVGSISLVEKKDLFQESVKSHTSGFQIVFLGTGTGHPGEQRRAGSLALRLRRSTWMFDCGEDTQRQVQRQPLVKNGKLDRIFITNSRTSNLLGLPGMLCTMSAAREVGLDVADLPLHIYGPPGLAEYIRPMLHLSDTFISMPIIVHELVDHAVAPQELDNPVLLEKRSCLYRVLVPPDKLNPKGYHDGMIVPFLSRATMTTNKLAKGRDERVNLRPLPLPPPGDPGASIEGDHDLRWSITADEDIMVTAARVPAEIDSWAYVVKEANRVGPLLVDTCEQLGVPQPFYGMLKDEQSVTTPDGSVVHPHQVLGPDIQGRKVTIVGESSESLPLQDLTHGCDTIIHCASCQESDANGLSVQRDTIEGAAALAAASEAHHLMLYRFRPNDSIQGPESGTASSSGVQDGALNGKANGNAKASSHPVPVLNALNNFQMTKKTAFGGYLWKPHAEDFLARNTTDANKATKDLIEKVLGRENSVSIAEDMDMFTIQRK